jgi:hypothetical protein
LREPLRSLIENGLGGTQPSTTYTVSSAATSTSARSPGGGLELSLTLNTTNLSAGRGVAATVYEMNAGTAPVNVSASADWPVHGLAVGPCGSLNYPVGLAVLSGNYDVSNASSGVALQIYRPGVASCPMILAGIVSFVFQASSDNATIFGGCQPAGPSGCLSETVNSTVSFSGYWSGGAFNAFPNWVYTVVAGDEWGGLAILHFAVTKNGA